MLANKIIMRDYLDLGFPSTGYGARVDMHRGSHHPLPLSPRPSALTVLCFLPEMIKAAGKAAPSPSGQQTQPTRRGWKVSGPKLGPLTPAGLPADGSVPSPILG